jgi:hypothetical protein
VDKYRDVEWLTVAEVAEVQRCHPDTVRERIRNRSRRDAIPDHLVAGAGHALRIHRSIAFPAEYAIRGTHEGAGQAEITLLRDRIELIRDQCDLWLREVQ